MAECPHARMTQVGIFGYTAYSASKFALRGLAEALQMELRPLGAAVTLAFPPDTDTPGLAFEVCVREMHSVVGGGGRALWNVSR